MVTAHRLSIKQLKELYREADREGRAYLKVVTNEKEYTQNVIATIKMNSCMEIKRHIQQRIGEIIAEEQDEFGGVAE